MSLFFIGKKGAFLQKALAAVSLFFSKKGQNKKLFFQFL